MHYVYTTCVYTSILRECVLRVYYIYIAYNYVYITCILRVYYVFTICKLRACTVTLTLLFLLIAVPWNPALFQIHLLIPDCVSLTHCTRTSSLLILCLVYSKFCSIYEKFHVSYTRCPHSCCFLFLLFAVPILLSTISAPAILQYVPCCQYICC